jgi:hypothetical protein
MEKLLIFGDNLVRFSPVLIREIHALVKDRPDITLCGVVDTAKNDPIPEFITKLKLVTVPVIKKIFNPADHFHLKTYPRETLLGVCARLNIRVITPPKQNINDPSFIAFLKDEVKPTLGLSVGCLQIFQENLIDLFDVLVNYHNGLLPEYGGLMATLWSIYHGEKDTGFTYHHVSDIIDGGHILVQDKIPLGNTPWRDNVEHFKTLKAAGCLGRVLDKMVAGDPGIAQGRRPTYFGKSAFKAITTIHEPGALTYEEILKRLLVFKCLYINIQGTTYPVTAIRQTALKNAARSKRVFVTKDNLAVLPVRFLFLPLSLLATYRFAVKHLLRRARRL